MRLNVYVLPALTALLFSVHNMTAALPWMSHGNSQATAQQTAPQAEPVREERVVKLAAHQGLKSLLVAQGLDNDTAADAVDAISDVFSPGKLKAGQEFQLQLEHDADQTKLLKLVFSPDPTQRIEMTQDADESFETESIGRQTQKRIVAIRGTVDGAFASSARRAGVPRSVANQMARWLAYDVDFQRDIHHGDQFAVMFPAEYDDQGQFIHADNIQYLQLNGGKTKINLYRYHDHMYHADGRDVRRSLLKTPVDGARISSGFGMRIHPVLGFSMMHKGVDFAAATGTPVFAAGDGVVQKASWFSTYGNYVLIHHNSTYDTAYAHLSRYARGIHPGVHVHQGQVIAYVGATGRATGPHLHFEVHQNGVQVNPTKVASLGNDRLQGQEMHQLAAIVRQDDANFAQLTVPGTTRVAQNNVLAIPVAFTSVR